MSKISIKAKQLVLIQVLYQILNIRFLIYTVLLNYGMKYSL